MRFITKNLSNICFLICLIINITNCFGYELKTFDYNQCKNDFYFMNVLKPEIQSKSSKVNEIINLVLNSTERYVTHKELETFVDTFGSRLSGSQALENSIDYLVKKLENEKLDRVYTEGVSVPKWERGIEWAEMVEPRNQRLSILGLGGTVSTRDDGITAELMVFRSLQEFTDNSQAVREKIVLFNTNNSSYFGFKLEATQAVAEAGALAVLFKSLSPLPLYLPHTGVIRYKSEKNKIPAASITLEDSAMFDRMTKRGDRVVIRLYIGGKYYGMTESRNLIAELNGTKYPDEVVIVSGHLDSWDVGQGALDDGGGAFISWRALSLLKKLGFKTKRTLRAVLFTGEEQGFHGAKAYVEVSETFN